MVMIRVGRALAAAVVVAALGIPSAGAQEIRGYLGVAGMLSTQGGHRQGTAPSLPATGAEGTAIGVTAEAGGLLTRRIALGIEVSLPDRFTSVQQTNHLRVFQQESRHRDVNISGLVRWIAGSSPRRMRLGIVGGGGIVQENSRQRRRDQVGPLPTVPPEFGPYSREFSFTRWTVAALAGADVEFAITPRVAVVPQMRVHFVRRSDDPSQPGWGLGLDSLVLRPAVGMRAAF
jgi:hypothetical protein